MGFRRGTWRRGGKPAAAGPEGNQTDEPGCSGGEKIGQIDETAGLGQSGIDSRDGLGGHSETAFSSSFAQSSGVGIGHVPSIFLHTHLSSGD